MQLNLRHIIRRDILIYPGYVPVPEIKYKVFHYGLRFGVGNWSFDKADWRDIDVVNICWSKFPEPPDPSTLSTSDDNILQRDILSIECGKALNDALYLHHKRRNCPYPSDSNASFTLSEDVGLLHELKHGLIRGRGDEQNIVIEVPSRFFSNSKDKPPSFWMVGLWAFSGMGLLALIFMILPRRKGESSRAKAQANRSKRSFA